ncbi:MAG: TonB-dependent receptor [Phycisphaerae bacterium]|nr:TonB-dependent receptor [Phycisphaerae bacterium]
MTWLLLLGGLVIAPYARAQEAASPPAVEGMPDSPAADEALEDIDLLDLDVPAVPMVVTAGRREQKITAVPYAVSVITADDIRQSGARSVPDALRLVPGIDVAELSFANAAVSPRGLHGFLSREVLVLVDGRQIFDSGFGGTLWGMWPFQLEDIARIEVIRGPGGVIWGANAMNGVINVITKDPEDQEGLTFTAGGGSRGTHKEHLGYAFADEKLHLRVSGEYEASDGFLRGGSILRHLEDDFKAGRTGVHAIYEAAPNDTLTLSGGSNVVDGGFPAPPAAGIGLHHNPGSQANYLLARWEHRIEADNAFQLTGYVNDFYQCPGTPAIDYRYQQFALQFSHAFKLNEAHSITWGFDSRTDILDTSNADPFLTVRDFMSTAILGLYVQDKWQFSPSWTLELGARMDYEFYGGFQPSARAALSYAFTEHSSVYAAASRAFQMPPVGSRFLDIPMANTLVHVTADQDLDVQTLMAYELGYRGKPLDRLDATLNLFLHDYDDVTVLAPTLGPPGLFRMHAENRHAIMMAGAEADLQYAVTDTITVSGHYTFQCRNGSLVASDHNTPPKHKFMLGARYSPTEDLHLSSHLYYVDAVRAVNAINPFIRRRIEPYFRLDLRAEHEFWDDHVSLAVGVRNLLDDAHYEGGSQFTNNAQVPRTVYAEMRVTFK